MTRPKILLATRLPERWMRLAGEPYEIAGPLARSRPDAVGPEAADARALVTVGTQVTDAALLAALPRLELVCFFGTGFEGIDLEAARARGLKVTHSPGANASSVADLALGLVIASARRLLVADRTVREGLWTGGSVERMPTVPGLTGARVGIYGLGAIGEKIARRVAACEAEIGYHNRRPRPDLPYGYHPTLLSLAAWADILVVAVRADRSNRHAVDAEVLRALGPQGHVVNISRGIAIDEEALIDALEAGTIAGAGLDVYEHEPAVPDRLKALPNVVLTPHIGGGTVTARDAQEDMVLANLAAHFGGRPVPNPVGPDWG